MRVLLFTAAGEENFSVGMDLEQLGSGAAPLDEALRVEREEVLRCSKTKDQMEGMMAFLEKRRPVFRGE